MAIKSESESINRRVRVLFFAESLSLCHITRPLVLAKALDPNDYEVHFACHPDYHDLVRGASLTLHAVDSLPSATTLGRLAKGQPMFSFATLRSYVTQDLQLMASIEPDIVVGDMRQSLAISAPYAKTTHCAITNAYWSPYAQRPFDVPELAATRLWGPTIVRPFFRAMMPLAFQSHAKPLNRLRKAYGLGPVGNDLGDIYAHSDFRLYADTPELIPTFDLPENHRYMGPVLWSSPVELPDWWEQLPTDRRIVYVSGGSSGRKDLVSNVVTAIKDLDVTIIAGTSESASTHPQPDNVFVAPVLPAEKVLDRADLFISHGGSASAYVALAKGAPVLGIPSNMDQHLSIAYVEQAGAGRRLRSEYASPARIRRYTAGMLKDTSFSSAAEVLAKSFSAYDANLEFAVALDSCVATLTHPGRFSF